MSKASVHSSRWPCPNMEISRSMILLSSVSIPESHGMSAEAVIFEKYPRISLLSTYSHNGYDAFSKYTSMSIHGYQRRTGVGIQGFSQSGREQRYVGGWFLRRRKIRLLMLHWLAAIGRGRRKRRQQQILYLPSRRRRSSSQYHKERERGTRRANPRTIRAVQYWFLCCRFFLSRHFSI